MKIIKRLLVAVGNSQSTVNATASIFAIVVLFIFKSTGLLSKFDNVQLPVAFVAFAFFGGAISLFSSGILDFLGIMYAEGDAQRLFGAVLKSLAGFMMLALGGVFILM